MHQCRPEQIRRLFQTAKSHRPRLVKLSVLIKILVQLSCGHSCTIQATSAQHLILVYFHTKQQWISFKGIGKCRLFCNFNRGSHWLRYRSIPWGKLPGRLESFTDMCCRSKSKMMSFCQIATGVVNHKECDLPICQQDKGMLLRKSCVSSQLQRKGRSHLQDRRLLWQNYSVSIAACFSNQMSPQQTLLYLIGSKYCI